MLKRPFAKPHQHLGFWYYPLFKMWVSNSSWDHERTLHSPCSMAVKNLKEKHKLLFVKLMICKTASYKILWFVKLTRFSILSLSSSLLGQWSDVIASALPSLLKTARQSPTYHFILPQWHNIPFCITLLPDTVLAVCAFATSLAPKLLKNYFLIKLKKSE